MQDEDARLFREAMAGVRPLKATPKVAPPPPQRQRRRRPSASIEAMEIPLRTDEEGRWDRLGERVFWQRTSLRPQDADRLKKGQFAKHWQLDLHGMTQDEAERELKHFLLQAWQLGARHALIIHGKGYNSENGPVLRTLTHQLLPGLPFVLAFSSAQPKDGDTGATYVLLKRHRDAD